MNVWDMDKLLPSPNSSLEEIQAWNNVMDSTVAFFKACNHVMHIMTNKVNAELKGGYLKEGSHLSEIMRGFEPECQPCKLRSSCGICGRKKRAFLRGASGTASTAEKSAPKGGGGDKCVCVEVKAKQFEEKKDRYRCPRNKFQEREEEGHSSEEHPVEVVCGWDDTPGNRVSKVMEKLATAQQEISRLQEEQAKLQNMKTSNQITPNGGPNPETLYREIMKDDADMIASRCSLKPPRGLPYPTRIPEVFTSGREARRPLMGRFDNNNLVLDFSTARSGTRTLAMPLAALKVARRYCPSHVYTPYSPSSMEAPSSPAVQIDEITRSSQSSMEISTNPNVFPPEVCPCVIRTQGCPSMQSSASSSQASIETSSQEYKEISPNPAYWSRLAVHGDSDAEDQLGCALH
ncbi:uncharacterized protein [Euwallacea fornicatus]|uniref:uncharacterized protein isoform X1 n=1 Tax=Euwallacea fornicatus TaxID=995702 RepID=UPI00338E2CEE